MSKLLIISAIGLLGFVPAAVPIMLYNSRHSQTVNYQATNITESPTPPSYDPAATPDGKMTNCQKQQYWLRRSFVTGVDSNTDMLLALYYQRECKG